ncbi:tubulin-dependent ATPase kip3 [Coemansia erecta]|uniref:Tubulin-dependent ATPase kip3 n=1 Tax=Coemansia erecta TaxID=147472 RepID=A0A9W8CSU1_9FUNG|nr:tubulin-dependent ATPase kip3 [Coemansia erecta]
MHSSGPLAASASGSAAPKAPNNSSSEAAILVAVRVRPFSAQERAQLPRPPQPTHFGPTARNLANYEDTTAPSSQQPTLRKVVHTIDDHVLVFDPPSEEGDRRSTVGASNRRHKDIRFVFDRVYGEESTQGDVYEGTTRGLLDSVMGGYNATVFAYGATGCGKTYTISGSAEDPGVIFLTMRELFDRISAAEDEKAIDVSLSYLEVYNETIRDLLAPESGGVAGLALREDAQQSITVTGLSEHVPGSVDQVIELMERGNANRTMSPTEANAVSSRSHAVLQVHVRQRPRASGLQTDVTTATLSIIDLAGSERATVARNSGTRLREGANINRSLLALANCINALCDVRTKRHVPYRDSKLTRLLKFSLGGNCRTVMITCVSPASTYYEETHNTLKYANRAKNIKTTVARNTKSTKVHLAQYQGKIREQSEEIKRLQREIAGLRSRQQQQQQGGGTRAGGQAAQAADLRKQTQAVQAVQDIRNKIARAYAPIRDAQWQCTSNAAVERWFGHHAEALRGWREQFETLFQEHEARGARQGSLEDEERRVEQYRGLRQQVDELMRELLREQKQVGRRAEHWGQTIERQLYEATRAAQVPPTAPLTAEQRYQVEQERLVLDLSAERVGLRRQAELAEHVAGDLARQNAMLLRLTAACMFNLRHVQQEMRRRGGGGEEGARDVDQVYLQAIAAYGEATRMAREAMLGVERAAGPAKLQVDGSTLTPPSPYVARTQGRPRETPLVVGLAADPPANHPNAPAISAAVAGTTRARRAVHMPPPQQPPALPGLSAAAARAPTAVRFTGPAAGRAANELSRAAGRTEGSALRARRLSHHPAAAAAQRRRNSTSADTISSALRSSVTISSPTERRTPQLQQQQQGAAAAALLADTSSMSLPSPSLSAVSSPGSAASWRSAEQSPHHEPLPAGARPAKGILKGVANSNGGSGGGRREEMAAAGPVRMGSLRKRSRQARNMANPTARTTPTKPPQAAIRELTFKSLAAAPAGPAAAAAAASSSAAAQAAKKPAWR